jgi:hypothetical protein
VERFPVRRLRVGLEHRRYVCLWIGPQAHPAACGRADLASLLRVGEQPAWRPDQGGAVVADEQDPHESGFRHPEDRGEHETTAGRDFAQQLRSLLQVDDVRHQVRAQVGRSVLHEVQRH